VCENEHTTPTTVTISFCISTATAILLIHRVVVVVVVVVVMMSINVIPYLKAMLFDAPIAVEKGGLS
jgi:hypothetical protein